MLVILSGLCVQVQRDFGFAQYGNTHIIVDVYYADSDTPVGQDALIVWESVLCDVERNYKCVLLSVRAGWCKRAA